MSELVDNRDWDLEEAIMPTTTTARRRRRRPRATSGIIRDDFFSSLFFLVLDTKSAGRGGQTRVYFCDIMNLPEKERADGLVSHLDGRTTRALRETTSVV